jgi:methylated-DNA-[protein]-cysteine S-methyltransferase
MTDSVRFPTAIGECSLSWNDHGLAGFALPADPRFPAKPSASGAARSAAATAAISSAPSSAPCSPSSVFSRQSSALCPPAISALVARVQRHLAGDLQDFADLAYDWSRVTEFQSRVLRAVLAIKPGRTATYGELAHALGAKPGTARAIGGAVGANPWPLLVPCHRILGASGKLTGYSAPGGLQTKAALLALEGVELMG